MSNIDFITRIGQGLLAVAATGATVVAPYALIELVLPGGSLMALLLWLYPRRQNRLA